MTGETLYEVFCRKEMLVNVEGLTSQHLFAMTNEGGQSSLTSQFHSNEQYCILTVQLFTQGLDMLLILIFKMTKHASNLLPVSFCTVAVKCCSVRCQFTGESTRLMENDGPYLFGLRQLFTRDPPQCAVSAHGE